MYAAKVKGRNTYCFYQAAMTERAQQRLNAERNLRRAIEQNEFEVWYQPQIDLATQHLLGAEALIRWRDPQHGLISPCDFIPLAEQNGMILPIGELVLHQVCKDFCEWQSAKLNAKRLSINVAGPQFYRGDIVATIKHCMTEYQIPQDVLEIEITETFMMENPQEIKDILLAIQALGVTIAIDDFGTGYSSLAYLRELPIDTLKIDRAFIRDVPSNTKDIAIIRAILALGTSMGFNVVAEGIETQQQCEFLQAEGCSEGQGYYFAKPMSKATFMQWLQSQADYR
jgi:EAL domain-containing protein (putative c-di-GMP-specific phosphodiesterase class I)